MSVAKTRSALVKAFKDGSFFDADKVAYENMAFTPPTTAPWASFNFIPAQPEVATLGAGGQDELTGFVQIDLNYPPNDGVKDINAKFEALRNVFTAGARFLYQGQEVVIRSCGRSQGRVVGPNFRVSVTIMFYSHINR